jgi:DNA-directed RNA polymerase specialized sigma24 family protein
VLDNPHALLPIAYQAAARVVRSPLLAEEASERALHLLTVACLQGAAPQNPRAWVREVARRSACALLRSGWARTEPLNERDLSRPQRYRQSEPLGDWVRECLGCSLSHRQQAAWTAALSSNCVRAAAKSCGMQPRDFRRSLSRIGRKARALLRTRPGGDTFADDVSVQFQLE